MEATILSLRRAPTPAPKPDIAPTHVTLQPAAKHAFAGADGSMNRLRGVFSRPSASVQATAEIDRLCADIITELQRVRRFSKGATA
jgi:hypothetical protein